ncbi:hypothetical protein JTB14_011961 [Gonioctena quinquepunctata]|nr:hypothetical protein JTB14_011961 [Gonioctena quinquepunctata]
MGRYPSSFRRRIRNGIITNLEHLDLRQFLDDCKIFFNRRIQNLLKKYEAVKVYTVFRREFFTYQGNEDSTEFKYLNTKNEPFIETPTEWFITNVMDNILTNSDEFQVNGSG